MRAPILVWIGLCFIASAPSSVSAQSSEPSNDAVQGGPTGADTSSELPSGEGGGPAAVAAVPSSEEGDVVDLTSEGAISGSGTVEASLPAASEPEVATSASVSSSEARTESEVSKDGDAGAIDRPNVINFSVFGLVGARSRLTYERMLRPRHGVFAEGVLSPDVLGGFDFISFGGALGYRFHWRGPARGPFVGAVVALERGNGSREVTEWGETEKYVYRGSGVLLTIAAHVGHRWQFENGLNFAFRVGAGVGLSWLDPDADAEPDAVRILEDFPPIGVDGEASVGYAF